MECDFSCDLVCAGLAILARYSGGGAGFVVIVPDLAQDSDVVRCFCARSTTANDIPRVPHTRSAERACGRDKKSRCFPRKPCTDRGIKIIGPCCAVLRHGVVVRAEC